MLASDTAYAPFESQDPQTGKYVGFDIDLVNAVAEVANLEIEIRSMNFDGIIPALETIQEVVRQRASGLPARGATETISPT